MHVREIAWFHFRKGRFYLADCVPFCRCRWWPFFLLLAQKTKGPVLSGADHSFWRSCGRRRPYVCGPLSLL